MADIDVSRLDLFIDRMVSQRACLDHAMAQTAAMTGPVFELGLGNGRTFDHIRRNIGAREVFVFERSVASHPDSTPDEQALILGDVRETLPDAVQRFGASASIIHADLGGHSRVKNAEFARMVSPLIMPLLAEGGLMVSSDQMYFFEGVDEVPLPTNAVEGRCFIYRRRSAG
jgi:hypothetical protein